MRFVHPVVILVALGWGLPDGLAARPSKLDRELLGLCRRSEKMLDKLDFERAREILEASARNPKYRPAARSAQARLWALLGRARAELGDPVGSDDAFVRAVRLYPKVRLSKDTSPKILAALERARTTAGGIEPPPDVEPPPPPPVTPPPPRVTPPPRPPPPRIAPPPPRVAPPTRRSPPISPPRTPRPSPPPPRRNPTDDPPPSRSGRWLRAQVRGPRTPGARVTIVAEHRGLPKRTRFEAYLRRTQSDRFRPVKMTKTGTVAQVRVRLNRRLELYLVAKRKRRVVARYGSPSRPIVITAGRTPPTLAEAWAEPVQPAPQGSAPPPSTAGLPPPPPTVAPPPPEPAAIAAPPRPSPPPPPPLAPPPPEVVPRSEPQPTEASPTVVEPAPSDGLATTEIALLAAGGAILVTGAVVLIVVLANQSPACNAPEGFGCAEVRVSPLVSF